MYSVTVGSLIVTVAVLPVTCRLLFVSSSYANKLVHSADISILSNKSTFSSDSYQFNVTENLLIVALDWFSDGNANTKIIIHLLLSTGHSLPGTITWRFAVFEVSCAPHSFSTVHLYSPESFDLTTENTKLLEPDDEASVYTTSFDELVHKYTKFSDWNPSLLQVNVALVPILGEASRGSITILSSSVY